MSHSTESSKQHPTLLEKEFFNHFFRLTLRPQELWKPLKDKFKYYKQQSYNVSKTSSQISYIKKFNSVCTYLPYVGNIRAEKIEIPLIQDTIEAIYNQFETFFADGGWRAVKNKSYKAHIQEYILMKLYKTHLALKIQGGLDSFVLAFFYTLNYYKTCNYQIRLFNNFLLNTDLESFFIFILLRKQSRRVNRDLSIKSEHISKFVRVLKGQKSFPSLGSYASENEEMGEVKLLLIYPQIIQFINNNGIVLHEILIYSLMKCSDMTGNSLASLERCNIDWNQFFNLYFNCSDEAATKPYSQQFIKKVVKANLKMGDSLVKLGESNITFVQDKYQPKQQFYEQSFEWLIGVIQGLIAEKQTCNLKWRQTYQKLIKLYEQKITLGNKLIEQIFRSQEYSTIYRRYSRVNKSVGYGSSV